MEKLKLTPLYTQGLHHAEFGQFIIRFYEDFAKTSLDASSDEDFKTMFDALQAKITTYNKALDQIRASEESKKIAEADRTRDIDVQALKDSIKPYRNTKSDAEADAFTAIKIVLDQYKGVENNAYEEETIKINTLLAKLQSSDYSAHITTLGIGKFITKLSLSNAAFNDLFAHRSYQNSQKEKYDVKALRKAMITDYHTMINYILALANVKTDTFYKDVLAVINNSRKYFSDVLARRNGTPPEALANPSN
jgi:hypothetical protein